jgi:hypothetical protein
MAFERAHRPPTKAEALKARQVEADARAVQAGAWVAKHMPDLNDPQSGVCSFAIALALRISRERPGIKAGELARVVRVQREVWMRRCGAWDESWDETEKAA